MITLGIIGIVAALTIPTLVHSYKKKNIETKLKKVYSIMNQAVGLSIANDTWTPPPTDKRNDNDALHEWLQTVLYPYMKVKDCYNSDDEDCKKVIDSGDSWENRAILPDGSTLNFNNNMQIHTLYTTDVSVSENNAKTGINWFYFFLDYEPTQKLGYFYPSGYAYSYANDDDLENEQMRDIYVYNNRDGMIKYCNSKYSSPLSFGGSTCALLIMHDGWKISDDYPVKF